eukprot:scaffold34637_cov108-Skeletonema_menzelii.AAC.1
MRKEKSFVSYLIWRWTKAHQAICSYYSLAALLSWLRNICIKENTNCALIDASLLLIFVAMVMQCWFPSISRAFWNKSKLIVLLVLVKLIDKLTTWRKDVDSTSSSPAESNSSQTPTTPVSSQSRSRRRGDGLWRRNARTHLLLACFSLLGANAVNAMTPTVGVVRTRTATAAASVAGEDSRLAKRPRLDTSSFHTIDDDPGESNAGSDENPFYLPPKFETVARHNPFKSSFEDPILQFLDIQRASANILDAAKSLLDFEGDDLSNDVRKSLRKGLCLLDQQYKSQAEFSKAVEDWKKELNKSIMKESG